MSKDRMWAEFLYTLVTVRFNKPESEAVQTAYRDLGEALRAGSMDAFRGSVGWAIVDRTSDYTRGAFTTPFSIPAERRFWRKYQLLPAKTPITSLDQLTKLTMPVHILANRNDFCHPFAYGEHLQKHIPGAVLTEIPDKDTDASAHRAAVQRAVRALFEPAGTADAGARE